MSLYIWHHSLRAPQPLDIFSLTQVREDENVDGETVAEFVPKISALQNQAQDETTHAVDGRNPARSGMYKSPVYDGGNLPIS